MIAYRTLLPITGTRAVQPFSGAIIVVAWCFRWYHVVRKGGEAMGKERNTRKDTKKKATKTLKEKRREKKLKKASKH
jgi:hypothetical protein